MFLVKSNIKDVRTTTVMHYSMYNSIVTDYCRLLYSVEHKRKPSPPPSQPSRQHHHYHRHDPNNKIHTVVAVVSVVVVEVIIIVSVSVVVELLYTKEKVCSPSNSI